MFKRIEFTLNMDDPDEAALYQALRPSLHGRRAGAVIRQALMQFYGARRFTDQSQQTAQILESTRGTHDGS